MANQLKMAMINAIWILKERGWSGRRIARELGINRETVGRYLSAWSNGSKPATQAPTGSEDSNQDKAPTGSDHANTSNETHGRSQCEPLRKVIEEKLQKGLTCQRIYQDIRDEYSFSGSYYSVRRFVKHIHEDQIIPFRRMECMPGDLLSPVVFQASLEHPSRPDKIRYAGVDRGWFDMTRPMPNMRDACHSLCDNTVG
ncbi:MAG: helix-turn-helix domain-containing protein [Sedimentisphaerales bacterium]|nr:helix-turn-helix domain-containing protein [Sedimentisphaerales bacterium]